MLVDTAQVYPVLCWLAMPFLASIGLYITPPSPGCLFLLSSIPVGLTFAVLFTEGADNADHRVHGGWGPVPCYCAGQHGSICLVPKVRPIRHERSKGAAHMLALISVSSFHMLAHAILGCTCYTWSHHSDSNGRGQGSGLGAPQTYFGGAHTWLLL